MNFSWVRVANFRQAENLFVSGKTQENQKVVAESLVRQEDAKTLQIQNLVLRGLLASYRLLQMVNGNAFVVIASATLFQFKLTISSSNRRHSSVQQRLSIE
jgi:hypothetical protein